MYYETVVIWDGELFAHTASTIEECIEWAKCYTMHQNAAPRVWCIQ